jgi:hypothetical protein
MDAEDEAKMAEIKEKIEQGEYRVDPRAVADAIVRRLGYIAAARIERMRALEHSLHPPRSWTRPH